MSFKPTVKIDPDDIVRYLLYQQFYYGEDRIYGRTKDCFEYIEGAGIAIEEFYTLITEKIKFIDEGHPELYLEFFNKRIHEITIKAIMDKYEDNKLTLGPEMDRGITLTVIVGECLATIQKQCFEAKIKQLIEYIMGQKTVVSESKEVIKRKIEALYGKSTPYIGMIYSLSFMEFIGEITHSQEIISNCKSLLNKYYDFVQNALE